MTPESPQIRLHARAGAWGVDIQHVFETDTSVIGVGLRRHQPVILKIVKRPGDEWTSGPVVRAFDGRGMVHVYEFEEGALLLEGLTPGHSLVSLALDGRDEDATGIIADVIQRMQSPAPPQGIPEVMDWSAGFEQYLRSGDGRIPRSLVEDAHRRFRRLAASQHRPRLLHGDLQHSNVLFDSNRGWLAIDPKGVVGEIEYEIGAVLRNPTEKPDLFASPATVTRRLSQFATMLHLNRARAAEWGYTQAVLSAIWSIEDGFDITADSPVLRLADVMRSMLDDGDACS